jgi:hypothetical protein
MTVDYETELPCAACGSDVPTPLEGGYWQDGAELTCTDCGAVNHVSCDEDGVVFSFYKCRHGKRDDEACDLCEIEDGSGVGEVAT